MAKKDKKVDEYINQAASFAQPVLNHLRKVIHKACPDVAEKIQWGCPCFDYRGASICSIVAYKDHCSISFWKSPLLNDPKKVLAFRVKKDGGEIGILGKLVSVDDLPSDEIIADLIMQAMKLNEDGIELPPRDSDLEIKELDVPDYFQKELNKNAKARKSFEAFRPMQRNNYLKWIIMAKTEGTRSKRIKDALEWIAEGKNWNWKYMKIGK